MSKQEHSIGLGKGNLPVINPNAAGIDIGADRHWVSVPVDRDSESVHSFACFTAQLQKALTEMNLQLHRVISDITGTTGLIIIKAIVTGKRNPLSLAALKDGRIKASHEEIAAALTGDYRRELVFILQPELQLYEFYQTQILVVDPQIEQCLVSFASKVDVTKKPLAKPKRRGKKQPGNVPQFDLRTH